MPTLVGNYLGVLPSNQTEKPRIRGSDPSTADPWVCTFVEYFLDAESADAAFMLLQPDTLCIGRRTSPGKDHADRQIPGVPFATMAFPAGSGALPTAVLHLAATLAHGFPDLLDVNDVDTPRAVVEKEIPDGASIAPDAWAVLVDALARRGAAHVDVSADRITRARCVVGLIRALGPLVMSGRSLLLIERAGPREGTPDVKWTEKTWPPPATIVLHPGGAAEFSPRRIDAQPFAGGGLAAVLAAAGERTVWYPELLDAFGNRSFGELARYWPTAERIAVHMRRTISAGQPVDLADFVAREAELPPEADADRPLRLRRVLPPALRRRAERRVMTEDAQIEIDLARLRPGDLARLRSWGAGDGAIAHTLQNLVDWSWNALLNAGQLRLDDILPYLTGRRLGDIVTDSPRLVALMATDGAALVAAVDALLARGDATPAEAEAFVAAALRVQPGTVRVSALPPRLQRLAPIASIEGLTQAGVDLATRADLLLPHLANSLASKDLTGIGKVLSELPEWPPTPLPQPAVVTVPAGPLPDGPAHDLGWMLAAWAIGPPSLDDWALWKSNLDSARIDALLADPAGARLLHELVRLPRGRVLTVAWLRRGDTVPPILLAPADRDHLEAWLLERLARERSVDRVLAWLRWLRDDEPVEAQRAAAARWLRALLEGAEPSHFFTVADLLLEAARALGSWRVLGGPHGDIAALLVEMALDRCITTGWVCRVHGWLSAGPLPNPDGMRRWWNRALLAFPRRALLEEIDAIRRSDDRALRASLTAHADGMLHAAGRRLTGHPEKEPCP